jgi:hypothetical protein
MTMSRMRAKFRINSVEPNTDGTQETLSLVAVGANEYGANGENEDNDFARFTPYGELTMGITNPDLLGVFNQGDTYYLDFTKAN